jgi:hypothetical protein
MRLVCGLALAIATLARADVCDPAKFAGSYAFQLSGTTTIAGTEKPTPSLGKLVFDGAGNVSGISSAMFTGLLLANPVTGSYEVQTDCSIRWKLQDDSGAFQNFAGTLSADLTRGQFHQADPGGAQRGFLQRTPDPCSAASLKPRYTYNISGTVIPMDANGSGRTVSARGTLAVSAGAMQVDSDCLVQFDLATHDPDGNPMVLRMRGYLVNGGHEILAIQTDPGAMVSGRFVEVAQ